MSVSILRRVTITERGWPGHFILGHRCLWRRNTLLELGERRLVVSSVGRCLDKSDDQETFMAIGGNGRMMETMTFVARYDDPYWEADIHRPLHNGRTWFSKDASRNATLEYEMIHLITVKHWQSEIESLVDPVWQKLTAVEDK